MRNLNITSPTEFLGYELGSERHMARWDKLVEYYELLSKQSDKIKIIDMGPSTEGNRFLEIIITSKENMDRIEELRQISMTLADPRGLSEEEINNLVEKGRCVCVQSMSMHATEPGGTQMAPILAYDLLSREDEEVKKILDEVVYVFVPCFNPDGEILVTDMYNQYLDTPYEGCHTPIIYHKYCGHDNNRDAFMANIVESQYMDKILFREWMPQAYQDHHQMGSNNARIFVAPYKNPLRKDVDPLVWRELNWYGAGMAYHMEKEGLDGVTSGAQYPSWGHYGFHWITNSHNIPGMLTEAASCKIATSQYVDPSLLRGDGDNFMPEYEAQTNFPNPWKGGWWGLKGIVDRQYGAAYGLLKTMSKNRREILSSMAVKALNQTKKGEESKEYAYIFPARQYDHSSFRRFLKVLLTQGVEIKRATEDFTVGNRLYHAGDIVVFLAQPKFGLLTNLIGETHYPDNIWTRDKSGALTAFDAATDTVVEYMGIHYDTADQSFKGSFEILKDVPEEGTLAHALEKGSKGPGAMHDTPIEEGKPFGYVISAMENEAYALANALMDKGATAWRIDTCPFHDFYVENISEEALEEAWKEFPVGIRKAGRPGKITPVKKSRIALYERYYGGNAETGWTRLLLEKFNYAYTMVHDADIVGGGLKDFDVLILASDSPMMLEGPTANAPGYIGNFVRQMPPEYRSGLGKEGADAIKKFVEEGGRVIAPEGSADYMIEKLNLPVRNIVKGVPLSEFNTHGSTLRAKVEVQDPIGYGMPEETLVFHWNGPVFDVIDGFHAGEYDIPVRFAEKDLLKSGLLVGEKKVANHALVVRAPYGKGDVVLYGFAPTKRVQTWGTFKLMLNALYLLTS